MAHGGQKQSLRRRTVVEDFGPNLRRLRKAQKLTLQQVADAVGCTKAYIWELEMREGQRPSAERVYALAKVLGVTMENVMGCIPHPAKPQWQGLTDEEIHDCFQNRGRGSDGLKTRKMIAAAIEAMLKEKNT